MYLLGIVIAKEQLHFLTQFLIPAYQTLIPLLNSSLQVSLVPIDKTILCLFKSKRIHPVKKTQYKIFFIDNQ